MVRALLFPGMWLLSVVLVCNAGVWWGDLAVAGVGVTSYGLASFRRPKSLGIGTTAKHVLFIALILIGSVEMPVAYGVLAYDSIGDAPDGFVEVCKGNDAPPISNGHGEVAVLRRRHCLLSFPEDGTDEYFVFVHQTQWANNKQNLVFRYDAGDDKGPAPRLSWSTEGSLSIVVDRPIYQVTFQRNTIDEKVISYVTGPIGCNGVWERLKSAILWSGCQ